MASEGDAPKPNLVEAVSESNTTQESDYKPPPVLNTESQIPPSMADTNNTYADKEYRLNRKRYWVEVFTLCAVVFYGWVAYRQWGEMEQSTKAAISAMNIADKALKESRDNFRKDQRPYLWLTKAGMEAPSFVPHPDNPGYGQVVWTWHFTNYGKTPAYKIRYYQFIKIGEKPFKPAYNSQGRPSIGAPTPPNKDDFATVVSDPGIKQDEFNSLLKVSNSIRISVRIEYTDSYGGEYETGICLSRLNSGAISYCGENSYIK